MVTLCALTLMDYYDDCYDYDDNNNNYDENNTLIDCNDDCYYEYDEEKTTQEENGYTLCPHTAVGVAFHYSVPPTIPRVTYIYIFNKCGKAIDLSVYI